MVSLWVPGESSFLACMCWIEAALRRCSLIIGGACLFEVSFWDWSDCIDDCSRPKVLLSYMFVGKTPFFWLKDGLSVMFRAD